MNNNTLNYFKIISSIPRESKNEKCMADYLETFCKEHNFSFYRDNFNNVLIKKTNNKRKPIILQSHLDMVCVKEPGYDFDFATMPLKLVEKDGYLSAYKTSLGADNGIGVAMILSLLDDNNDFNIEALFTTDEESTMIGATNFDYTLLSSNKLISLDGFGSNHLVNGCASICDMKINFNPQFLNQNEQGYSITISGLKGGHSGADIHKNIGNAIEILTNILLKVKDIKLGNMQGGNQFNFIPNYAFATFVGKIDLEEIESITKEYKNQYKDIKIEIKEIRLTKFLTQELTTKILNTLVQIKTGVLEKDENGNIIISQNLSSISLEEGLIKISERAHNKDKENLQIQFLQTLAKTNGFTFSIFDKQEGLIPEKDSTLTSDLCEINKCVNNYELQVGTKHISFEGPIFKQKKSDLDIAVVSPDIFDAHSTKERVYIPSIDKTYNLIYNFLKLQ